MLQIEHYLIAVKLALSTLIISYSTYNILWALTCKHKKQVGGFLFETLDMSLD